ncbi:MAG: M28 family peptidase [Candidatus Kapabacteria bacterium]|nr:M28 family peptidase [Candidatus Kapabacteria bacterium]
MIFHLPVSSKDSASEPLMQSVLSLNPINFREVIHTLGHDSMMGRPTDGKIGNKAAEVIANRLADYGILPGLNGSYFQNIPLHEISVLPESEFKIECNETIEFALYEDYIVNSTGMMSYLPRPLDIVFAGFGIFAPEFDYNDYQNIDVSGKVVVLLNGEPYSEDLEYFNGIYPTIYSNFQTKAKYALARGAKACIILLSEKDLRFKPWADMLLEYNLPEMTLAQTASEILTIIMPYTKADKILDCLEITIEQDEFGFSNFSNESQSKATFSFKGKYTDKTFLAPNVVGIIQGRGENVKDEYLLLSAHYDHLGIGVPIDGDSIYNGVLDNAMGVSALLELSRLLNLFADNLNRNIIIVFTTAEERGLLGSIYYAKNPVVPLYKTIANLNIDGIAFIDNFNSVIGVGSDFSELNEILNKVAEKNNLYVELLPYELSKVGAFNRSDQTIFAQAGIPSMLVMEGTDYENISHEFGFYRLYDYMVNYYHSPFDDLNFMINYDAALQHVDFLLSLSIELINSEKVPEWYEGTKFEIERLRTRAERR